MTKFEILGMNYYFVDFLMNASGRCNSQVIKLTSLTVNVGKKGGSVYTEEAIITINMVCVNSGKLLTKTWTLLSLRVRVFTLRQDSLRG